MVAPRDNYHLLIADDDAGFREVLRDIFLPHFELVEAQSGEEAIEVVGSWRVDIALLDMNMDVLTGIDTIRALKSMYETAPCILITANANDDVRRDATEADAFDVLKKPVTKDELLGTVSSAIETAYHDSHLADLLAG